MMTIQYYIPLSRTFPEFSRYNAFSGTSEAWTFHI